MGNGFGFICKKCGESYGARTGVGYLFPLVYKEIVNDIKAGKYGEEWKDIICNEKLIAVDAEDYVYICRKCGNWETEPALSLYKPCDPEAIAKEKYGDKTVEEMGGVPYVMSYDLQENYHLRKVRIHKCSCCGGTMHKASKKEMDELPCPNCKTKPDSDTERVAMLWD